MVIALAGRRIDPAGAPNPSFPAENINRVRERLRDLFKARNATILVSSAACGADLLGLEAAGALALRTRIILPFPPDRFRETSVIDRPGDWGPLYDRIVADALSRGDLETIGSDSEAEAAYAQVNLAILDEAANLSRAAKTPTVAVLVWDGVSRGETDLTQAFGLEAVRRGFQLFEILTV